MKGFVISQFNYCPLFWMFHNRALNNRTNKIHDRALRLGYPNKNLSFNELLKLGNAVTIHQRNLKVLVTEIFKFSILRLANSGGKHKNNTLHTMADSLSNF